MLSYAGFHRPHRHYAGEAAAVVAAEGRAERADAKLEAKEAAAKALALQLTNKGAAVVTSGLMGAYQGYKGKVPEPMGVGLDLIVGGLASVAGLAYLAKAKTHQQKMVAEAIDGIGTGSLAFWAANQGNMFGLAKAQKSAAAAPAAAAAKTAGYEGDPRQFAPHFDASVEVEQSSSVPYGYR